MSEFVETLRLRFQSGNEIPVERAMITRQEFEALEQQLKTAKAIGVMEFFYSLTPSKLDCEYSTLWNIKKAAEQYASKLDQGEG